MSDNNNNNNSGNQSQDTQSQATQSTSRDFVQTDTSTNAYMQKGENPTPLTTKETK